MCDLTLSFVLLNNAIQEAPLCPDCGNVPWKCTCEEEEEERSDDYDPEEEDY